MILILRFSLGWVPVAKQAGPTCMRDVPSISEWGRGGYKKCEEKILAPQKSEKMWAEIKFVVEIYEKYVDQKNTKW